MAAVDNAEQTLLDAAGGKLPEGQTPGVPTFTGFAEGAASASDRPNPDGSQTQAKAKAAAQPPTLRLPRLNTLTEQPLTLGDLKSATLLSPMFLAFVTQLGGGGTSPR